MCMSIQKIPLSSVKDVLSNRTTSFNTRRYATRSGVTFIIPFGDIKNSFDLMRYRERVIFGQYLPERAALNQYVSPMSARVQQAANQWRLQAKRLGNGLGFKFAPAIERKRRYTKDAIIKAIRFYSNNGVNRNVSN